MLVDEAKIFVASGKGGDGLISFRREKFVPRGGPSGGDGGRGGHVIFVADSRRNTLAYFQKHIHFKAVAGHKGGSSNKTGANAADLEIQVPPGTVIRDAETDRLIADLVRPGDRVVVVPGGRGGKGNIRFKTAANQAPRVAEKGEPGEERWIKLELKLIADIGIVGVPNAGKSTLLSVISNAKPKIADYPFTTLQPNLGVVVYDNRDLVFADIPGLIEGAHMGVGLGHTFLRHVQRTRVLLHLLDGTSDDPLADYNQINSELALYDERLKERPQIVIYTKMDLPDVEARWDEIQAKFQSRGVEVMAISAVTKRSILLLIQHVFQVYSEIPQEIPTEMDETPLYELPEEDVSFTVSQEKDGSFLVSGKRIERAAAMTYWDYEEAVLRFQKILEVVGVSRALEHAGVQAGDTVFIGNYELEWSEQ